MVEITIFRATPNDYRLQLLSLKKKGYVSKPIKTEIRDNLIGKIKNKEPLFEGIIGYEETVIPQLMHAFLSEHNINLLGLRGQAKTKIARSITHFLDEYIPIDEGSQINDDPFNPLSYYAKALIQEKGDQTPIQWMYRSERCIPCIGVWSPFS